MIKKTSFLCFILMLIFLKSDISNSDKVQRIFLSGVKVNAEVSPPIINESTFFPISPIIELLDHKLVWNASHHQVMLGEASSYKVVIDPGHGGEDVGAVSVHGRFEKDFTLSVALKVRRLMEKESAISVYLTRTNDTYISLDDRINMANQLSANVFLSIHANTDANSNTKGTKAFFNRKNSLVFTQIIQKHIQKATGFSDLYYDFEKYRVIKNTIMPAALVEVGFLSNTAEEKALFMDNNQDKIASSIVAGIKEYLGI
jgi:N-acetylmuramoyl-L-alanine amidase